MFVVSYRYRTYGLGAGSDALGSETDPDSYRLFILGSFFISNYYVGLGGEDSEGGGQDGHGESLLMERARQGSPVRSI